MVWTMTGICAKKEVTANLELWYRVGFLQSLKRFQAVRFEIKKIKYTAKRNSWEDIHY